MNENRIKEILSEIREPLTGSPMNSDGFVKNISMNGKDLNLHLAVPVPHDPQMQGFRELIAGKVKKEITESGNVNVVLSAGITAHGNRKKDDVMPGVKNTIAVASGKGGVGKSTVAVNIAASLARKGFRVGLIDADIYGPSLPLMFGISEKPGVTVVNGKNKLVPIEKYGVKVMSIGFLMEENTAVVWRGPMASSALKQFMGDVVWGELDFLLFDMPPGTGDIQLTLSQSIPLTGAVVVTTPQEISLADARKGYIMFEKVGVPTIGIVENMSYYINADGSRDYIFGKGGGEQMCRQFGIELLGEVPVKTSIRISGDEGVPVTVSGSDKEIAAIYDSVADNLAVTVGKLNEKRGEDSGTVIEF